MVHIQNITNNQCVFHKCGDFNTRTSNADYVEDDSVEHTHVLSGDYLGRVSEDKGFNVTGMGRKC